MRFKEEKTVDLDTILQNIADGIIVQDVAGNILYANKEALKRTGFKTVKEMSSIPPQKMLERFEIMDEFGTPIKSGQLPAAIAVKEKKDIYIMVRYKNNITGVGGWASIRAKPVLGKNKKIKYIINLLRFVTDRYLAQRKLKLEYETARILAQGMSVKETIKELEKSICKILGCNKSNWFENKKQEKAKWHLNRKTKTTSITFPVKIGNTIFGVFEFNSPDLRPEDSDLLSTFSNISFQIAEFIQRKRTFDQLERQRQGFVALVTHELKTPLTSIKGYAQIVNSKIHHEYIDRIISNVDSLTNLVNGLLDIAQSRSGKIKFNKRSFSIDKLIDQVIANIDPVVKHKFIRTGQIDKMIKGDKERIAIVISNLISNAIKYSPNAKKIKIKTWMEGDKALVSVQDFGIGIPPDAQENIFQLFYRVGTPDVTKTSGVGLGLYISATIIKAHGGRIWVKSKPGRGSTFFISIPFNPVSAKTEELFHLI